MREVLKPAPHRWPSSADMRVHRDGARLRVYGASFSDADAARRDAENALRRYLAGLDVAGEPGERETRLRKALKLARPAAERAQDGGFTAGIDLSLNELQAVLGTHYE